LKRSATPSWLTLRKPLRDDLRPTPYQGRLGRTSAHGREPRGRLVCTWTLFLAI
jgi:hypothetical protein